MGRLPDAEPAADGPHAANLGGSSLAITASSKNKEAAWAYVNYALGTNEGQVTMLQRVRPRAVAAHRARRSLRQGAAAFWGGQAVWQDVLGTLDKIQPIRGTPFFGDADEHRAGGADRSI